MSLLMSDHFQISLDLPGRSEVLVPTPAIVPEPGLMNRIMYSTDGSHDSQCEICGFNPCRCPAPENPEPGTQSPRVKREKAGRGGKVVTVIYDLLLPEPILKDLAKELRHACSTGGTIKDGRIELRGDQRDRAVAILQRKGFKARAAGG